MNIPLKSFKPVDVRIRDLTVEVRSARDIWGDASSVLNLSSKVGSRKAKCPSKTILDGISADMPAGSLTAILGGSGSGKTTLLNTISHRISRKNMDVFGSVTFNDNEDPNSVRSAYVMQDDILLPTLTVQETLEYAVDLRLPLDSTKKEREVVVEETILELGLKECRDTRIGNTENSQCSGGEKRRTSVGVQLLADPSVLFCDEPTTGLDAHSAFQIVQTLKNLASAGRTVLISIHAPRSEIWNLFDRIILLSNGTTLYSGPADGAVPHFKQCGFDIPPFVNPAEFLMDLAVVDSRSESVEKASLSRIQILDTAWKSKMRLEVSSLEPNLTLARRLKRSTRVLQSHNVGFLRQLVVMTKRTMKTTVRDPLGMFGCMVQAMLMALGYGWIFFQLSYDVAGNRSREGALYIATYQSYLTLMFEIYRLTIDIRLFDMERSDGVVSIPAYLLSRRLGKAFLEDLPVPITFTLVYYFMVGFRTEVAAFFVFLAIVVALHYVAVTLALLCVSISRDFATASLIANLSYTLNFLCTGYILQTEQLPVYLRWLKWITYNFYTFVSLALNEFVGFTDIPAENLYDCSASSDPTSLACKQSTAWKIIESLGFITYSLPKSLAVSLIFPFIFITVAGIALALFKVDIDVARIKHKPEAVRYDYGNPISQPSRKVSGVELGLEQHGLELRTRHLFKRSSSKVILHPLSVTFPSGKMNIIMGPSGSGKTSLLRSLSKKIKSTISTTYYSSGQITMNGIPVQESALTSSISFVPQDDDALMPALTVRETLRYAAGMRLPPSMSKEQKQQRAEDLIVQMGLTHCADHLIGSNLKRGVSGGEKRRVSIAIQVLADPLVLLLDEPTSGLDVCTAATILDVLRALADEGRTIIMTCHQSRSDAFKTFDNVLLLARGGSLVYTGEAKMVLPHFKDMGFNCGLHTNPADFVLDLITVDLQRQDKEDLSRRRVEKILEGWGKEKQASIVPTVRETDNQAQQRGVKRRNPFWEIFLLVLRRSALNIRRTPDTIIARTTQVVGMSGLFALFYAPLQSNEEAIQSRMGYIQTITSFCFIGMLQNVAVYPTERDIFYREFADGCYPPSTFLLTYTLLELPFTLFSSLIFGLLASFAVNLQRTPQLFLITSLNCFCIVSCGESLAIVCCTLFSSHIGLAMLASSAILSFASTMAGIVSLHIPLALQAFNYLSPSKYSVANVVAYAMRDQVFTCTPQQQVDGRCPIATGEEVMQLYNLDVSPGWNLVALVVTTVLYRLVAFLVLKASRMEWRLDMVTAGKGWGWWRVTGGVERAGV